MARRSSPTARRVTATTFAVPDEFKVFTNIESAIVDPKTFRRDKLRRSRNRRLHHSAQLIRAGAERSSISHSANVLTICLGKSTYARCGIIVNVTPLEPEWEGHVTLEFSNTTPLPAKIYANEGVAQNAFLESDEVCEDVLQGSRRQIPGSAGRNVAKNLSRSRSGLEVDGLCHRRAIEPVASSPKLHSTLSKQSCCVGINLVLDGQHPRGQWLCVVTVQDRNAALDDGRPTIKLFGDEMDGAAVPAVAGVEARWCVFSPGYFGSSDGWMFSMPAGKASTKRGVRMRMKPARMTRSGE